MNRKKLFLKYCADRREQEIPGFRADRFAHLIRFTPSDTDAEGLVIYTNLTPGQESQQINEQIEYFSKRKLDFEWKVYEFDQSDSLLELLESHSFVAGEEEAFMVYNLEDANRMVTPKKQDWDIRRVTSLEGIQDIVSIQEQVWKQPFGWLLDQLHQVLMQFPNTCSIYCAYHNGIPIGTGWVDYPVNSEFPELHGGSVVKEWRRRGVYSDLYDHRLMEVAHRGYQYLTVDASTMSRPILEKIGFKFVCQTFPMRRKF